MANRYRANFLYGVLSGFNNSQTTFTGTGFPSSIPTGYYLPIIINPGYNGSATASGEVVYVTNITGGNVITVSGRGFEGTTAITGTNGTAWLAGPLVSDFDVSNLTSSGTLTLSGTGGITVSGAATFNGGVTANSATITGNLTVSGSVSVPSGSIGLSALAAGALPSGVTTTKIWSQNSTAAITGISGYNNYLVFIKSTCTTGATPGNFGLSATVNGVTQVGFVNMSAIAGEAETLTSFATVTGVTSSTSFSAQLVRAGSATSTFSNDSIVVLGTN